MKNKGILDQMGIQQWRLREALGDVDAQNEAVAVSPAIEDLTSLDEQEVKLQANTESTADANTAIEQSEESEIYDQGYDWSALIEILNDKQRCGSCSQVTPILGDGDITADWMFVFDSPTVRDIEQQELLTGRVGQLFEAILLALNLNRNSVYLSSIFKCPPTANISENTAQCDALLQHQIKLVQPKVIIAFGEFVSQALIKANESLDQLRQQPQQHFDQSITVIPTHGLMQILESPLLKGEVWNDLKSAISIVAV